MRTIERPNRWKRSFSTFLAFTLIASSLSLSVFSSKAEAASTTALPGGIDASKISLWVNADGDIVADDQGVVSQWADASAHNQFTIAGTPQLENATTNFNPSVAFDGFSYLQGDTEITMEEAYTVAMWNGLTDGPNGQTTKGTVLSSILTNNGSAQYYFWIYGNYLYTGPAPYNTVPAPVDQQYHIWNATEGLYQQNGGNVHTTVDENSTTIIGTPQIGKRNNFESGNNMGNMNGNIAEVIVLNEKANDSERSRINSYLALKYGMTLNNGASNYVDTSNQPVWVADPEYASNIAGIARDDAQGLYQKQSHSIQAENTNAVAQVLIGLNTLTDTNIGNQGTLTDKQYLIWGDNGVADNDVELKFTTPVGTTHKNQTERIWKVQNTGNIGEVNIAIPQAAVPSVPTLFIGSNATDFASATPYSMTELTVAGVDYFVTKATLENGQYFTFAVDDALLASLIITEPGREIVNQSPTEIGGQVQPDSTVTVVIKDKQGNIITTGPATVTGDSWNFVPSTDLTPGEYTIVVTADKNGDTVTREQKLVIVDKTALQNKTDEVKTLVEQEYTAQSWSNLEQALEAAELVLANPSATQAQVDAALAELQQAQDNLVKLGSYDDGLQITQPDTVTSDTYPTIGGLVDVLLPSSVTFTLKNDQGDNVLENIVATVNPTTGEWSWPYTLPTGLPNGTYTIIATATNGQQTATKQHTFLVDSQPSVDKTALQHKAKEADTLVEDTYTAESWSHYQDALWLANRVLIDPDATQGEVDAALAHLTAAQDALIALGKGLSNLTSPAGGSLSPSFQTKIANYTMTVGYPTAAIDFTAIPVEEGAKITTTVNGQAGTLDQIPLRVGENIIIISVLDQNGQSQHYTIKVYRQADSSSPGSGGGGNSGGGSPSPQPKPDTKTKVKIELEIDGEHPLETTTIEIERTKRANGQTADLVAFTEKVANEAAEKAKQIGNHIARIVIPDTKDEVDETTIQVSKASLQILRDNSLSLEIATENGHIAIPASSISDIDRDFYFRLVPVKKESERQLIEQRARAEQVVRETLQTDEVHVVARPMTIETNMPSRPVQVTLPLKGIDVPGSKAGRDALLAQLGVFIEHTDGEKKVVLPELVSTKKDAYGLRFTVDKFSTFTIIQFDQSGTGTHNAYIKGFADGTFGPEKNVTRAQVATMIARILGYTDGQVVETSPFKDVATGHSAAGAIAFVKQQGIMNGDQNGNFHAGANITRAEMATVVANYKQLPVADNVLITFNDTEDHWAQWIIEANRAAGIIQGLEDGRFAPDASLTRAQAVVMINRMFERGPLYGVLAPSFPDVSTSHWAFRDIEEAAKSHTYIIDSENKEQLK